MTKITHTHSHVHSVTHPDAWNRKTSAEPHTHEHTHTSRREAFLDGDRVVHRHHAHTPENRPVARPYQWRKP